MHFLNTPSNVEILKYKWNNKPRFYLFVRAFLSCRHMESVNTEVIKSISSTLLIIITLSSYLLILATLKIYKFAKIF